MKQIEKIRVALVLGLFSIIMSACCSQKTINNTDTYSDIGGDTFAESGMEFYTCISGTSQEMRDYLREKNIKRAVLVGGHFIEKDHEFTVNKDNIDAFLDKAVSDRESDAMIVLDFEGQKMTDLLKTSDEAEADRIVDHYIGVFKYFKKQRPNATIGYYGYPFRDYWHRNEQWKKNNKKIYPLMKELDVLFPSIYDFYDDKTAFNKNGQVDQEYVHDNAIEGIKIGAELNKPVMPFIWHRIHDSNKKLKRNLIRPNEFYKHVRGIVKADYNGNKIDGLIWWSSEGYFYRIKEAEYKKDASINYVDHQYKMGRIYLGEIEKALNQGCD